MTNDQILAELLAQNGNIFHTEVSDPDAFAAARADGVISFDSEFCIYLHPDAVPAEGGGWTMPGGEP